MNGSTGAPSTITDMDEHSSATTSSGDVDFSTKSPNVEPSVGGNVSVFWPEDGKFYPGTVREAEEDGRLDIRYDDGDTEALDMTTAIWKFNNALAASFCSTVSDLQVPSTEEAYFRLS